MTIGDQGTRGGMVPLLAYGTVEFVLSGSGEGANLIAPPDPYYRSS